MCKTSFISILKNIGKSILNFIIKAFKWIFSNFKNFIIALLFILCIVFALNYYTTEKELDETKTELINTNDSIFVYKNKVDELYAATEIYVTDIKELKKVNEDLYKEYKNLKEHPIVIEKINTIVKLDTIYIKDKVVVDSLNQMYTANFNYKDDYCNISGATVFNLKDINANTAIYNVEFPATFTTDIIEKSGKLYFLTKCDNPYVEINNIEGAIISPEQSKVLRKKFDKPWGVMIGVGPAVIIVDNSFKIYPALQLTVGYKIFSF